MYMNGYTQTSHTPLNYLWILCHRYRHRCPWHGPSHPSHKGPLCLLLSLITVLLCKQLKSHWGEWVQPVGWLCPLWRMRAQMEQLGVGVTMEWPVWRRGG